MEWTRDDIDRYLRGEMDANEAKIFEEALVSNVELTKRVEEIRKLSGGIRFHNVSKVLDRLKNLEELRQNPNDEELAEEEINKIEQAEGYLLGVEALRYEKLPKEVDHEMKHQVQELKKIIAGIRFNVLRQRLIHLKKLEKELPAVKVTSKQIPRKRWIWGVGIAASLALAVTLAWPWIRPMSEGERLFEEYFEPYPVIYGTRSNNEVELLVGQATSKYLNKEYRAAIKYFEELIEKYGRNEFRLYMGISYMALNKDHLARHNLEEFIKKRAELQDEAHWYLALLEMRSGNTNLAIEILPKIKHPNKDNLLNYLKN